MCGSLRRLSNDNTHFRYDLGFIIRSSATLQPLTLISTLFLVQVLLASAARAQPHIRTSLKIKRSAHTRHETCGHDYSSPCRLVLVCSYVVWVFVRIPHVRVPAPSN